MSNDRQPSLLLKLVGLAAAVLVLVAVAGGSSLAVAEGEDRLQSCLQDAILAAPDHMTAGEMRSRCQEKIVEYQRVAEPEAGGDAVEQRLAVDRANVLRPFTIMAHRQNYFLFGAYNFQGYSSREYILAFEDEDISVKNSEAQFQLSIKTPLATSLFDNDLDLYAGYTARSFWQVYHTDISSPFRETNHEPEIWLQTHPGQDIFGLELTTSIIGLSHQSNGQSRNLSRSWNRIYGDFIFTRGNFALAFKPWIRLEEDFEDDDNPDITEYLGHGEIRLVYKHHDHTFSLMSRNSMESGFSKGAVEFGWSFPFFRYPYLKGYIQYFSGYGESLIDYNRYVSKIGIGVLFSDFL